MSKLVSNILIAIGIIVLIRAVIDINNNGRFNTAQEPTPTPTAPEVTPTPNRRPSPAATPFDDDDAATRPSSRRPAAGGEDRSVPALW